MIVKKNIKKYISKFHIFLEKEAQMKPATNASRKGLATSNLKGCGGKLKAKQKIHFKISYISIPIDII